MNRLIKPFKILRKEWRGSNLYLKLSRAQVSGAPYCWRSANLRIRLRPPTTLQGL